MGGDGIASMFKRTAQFKDLESKAKTIAEQRRVAKLNKKVDQPKPSSQRSGAARTAKDITPKKVKTGGNLFGASGSNTGKVKLGA